MDTHNICYVASVVTCLALYFDHPFMEMMINFFYSLCSFVVLCYLTKPKRIS